MTITFEDLQKLSTIDLTEIKKLINKIVLEREKEIEEKRLANRTQLNIMVDEHKFNDLIDFGEEVEIRYEENDTKDYFFEDDGTLFYRDNHILIYDYYGQDNRITKKEEKEFIKNAKNLRKKIEEFYQLSIKDDKAY